MTGAQTLSVVYGLVGNMKVVMEGAECSHNFLPIFLTICFYRRQGFNRWHSEGFGYVFHGIRYHPCRFGPRVCSRSSRSVKRYEQDETFVVFPAPFVAETDGIL